MLATGVSYRQLDASGVDDLVGRGVYYGSAATEAAACAGRSRDDRRRGQLGRPGRGLLLPARGAVTLAVRGDSLERSMSSYLIEQIRAIDNIDVRLNSSVCKCDGNDHLQCVTLIDNTTAASRWSTPGTCSSSSARRR